MGRRFQRISKINVDDKTQLFILIRINFHMYIKKHTITPSFREIFHHQNKAKHFFYTKINSYAYSQLLYYWNNDRSRVDVQKV